MGEGVEACTFPPPGLSVRVAVERRIGLDVAAVSREGVFFGPKLEDGSAGEGDPPRPPPPAEVDVVVPQGEAVVENPPPLLPWMEGEEEAVGAGLEREGRGKEEEWGLGLTVPVELGVSVTPPPSPPNPDEMVSVGVGV